MSKFVFRFLGGLVIVLGISFVADTAYADITFDSSTGLVKADCPKVKDTKKPDQGHGIGSTTATWVYEDGWFVTQAFIGTVHVLAGFRGGGPAGAGAATGGGTYIITGSIDGGATSFSRVMALVSGTTWTTPC